MSRAAEEKVAYLEKHIEEQDRVILELSRRLDRLEKHLKLLAARVPTDATGGEERAAGKERPPHY